MVYRKGYYFIKYMHFWMRFISAIHGSLLFTLIWLFTYLSKPFYLVISKSSQPVNRKTWPDWPRYRKALQNVELIYLKGCVLRAFVVSGFRSQYFVQHFEKNKKKVCTFEWTFFSATHVAMLSWWLFTYLSTGPNCFNWNFCKLLELHYRERCHKCPTMASYRW